MFIFILIFIFILVVLIFIVNLVLYLFFLGLSDSRFRCQGDGFNFEFRFRCRRLHQSHRRDGFGDFNLCKRLRLDAGELFQTDQFQQGKKGADDLGTIGRVREQFGKFHRSFFGDGLQHEFHFFADRPFVLVDLAGAGGFFLKAFQHRVDRVEQVENGQLGLGGSGFRLKFQFAGYARINIFLPGFEALQLAGGVLEFFIFHQLADQFPTRVLALFLAFDLGLLFDGQQFAALDEHQGRSHDEEFAGDFEVEPITRERRGTSVTLHLRDDSLDFLSVWKLKSIVSRYSDHISLPILMRKEEWQEGQDGQPGDMVLTDDWETVNQATALWTRSKKDITPEQYRDFYKQIAHDHPDPLAWSHNRVFPGQDRMAQDIGSSKSVVNRAVLELQKAGWLEVTRRGQGKTNLYVLKHTVRRGKRKK